MRGLGRGDCHHSPLSILDGHFHFHPASAFIICVILFSLQVYLQKVSLNLVEKLK